MRIGIITILGMNNYGNRLQNYAMQKILSDLNCDVETIRWKTGHIRLLRKLIVQLLSHVLPGRTGKLVARIKRKGSFFGFERNIHYSKPYCFSLDHHYEFSEYDFLVYGSDQIWNTEFRSFSVFFLGYNTPKEKNIAVSASIGKDHIDNDKSELFVEGVRNFRAISVREKTGATELQRLTGNDYPVTIDPTLCISRNHWERLEKRTSIKTNYIVTYFLGRMQTIRTIQSIEVVHCEKNSSFGPSEFLYLLHHAKEIHTDSFHACVFAIIYGVDLFYYNRQSEYSPMNSRIDSLFAMLGIETTKRDSALFVSKSQLLSVSVQKAVLSLRLDMKRYLLDCLQIGAKS